METSGARAGRSLSARLAIPVMAGLLIAGLPANAGRSDSATSPDPLTDMALIAALDGLPSPMTRVEPAPGRQVTAHTTKTLPDGRSNPSRDDALTHSTTTRGLSMTGLSAMMAPVTKPTSSGQAEPAVMEIPAAVKSGDTLIGLLIGTGVDRVEAHRAIKALEEVYDPRGLRPGNVVTVRFGPSPSDEDSRPFDGFSLQPALDTTVVVSPDPASETGFRADENKADLVREVVRFGGPITYSLYQAAVDAGVSETALSEMIRVLSYDIDFQRDIQKDDTFEIMYERFDTPNGQTVRTGELLFTALTNGGKRLTAYPFEHEDGRIEYFNERGQGVRKPLMRTPIDGARISSSFGMRRHPILGYSKMHTGVDFAAPTGTPIYAAGDGVVKRAGRNGGYGNYVQIRHNGEFSTAYGHMSRILVKPGQRVRQGDVIGRVGTTGRSTGPHLHYEIIQAGHKVNPMNVRFQPATKLAGAELERFLEHKAEIDQRYASLRVTTEVASTASRPAAEVE